jgi:hypothetical protein
MFCGGSIWPTAEDYFHCEIAAIGSVENYLYGPGAMYPADALEPH